MGVWDLRLRHCSWIGGVSVWYKTVSFQEARGEPAYADRRRVRGGVEEEAQRAAVGHVTSVHC